MKNILILILGILIMAGSCTYQQEADLSDVVVRLNSNLVLEDPAEMDSFIALKAIDCPLDEFGNAANFESTDTLYPYIDIIYVSPDPSLLYPFSFTSEELIDTIQKSFLNADTYIKPILRRDTVVVEEDILHNYSNYKYFIEAYKQDSVITDEAFAIVIFPIGVKFRQEVKNGRRVSMIHGSSISIISEAGFLREESSIGPIAAHELAHYWGLRHSFSTAGGEDVDFGLSCTTGDLIHDTPYVPKDAKFKWAKDSCFMYTLDTLYPDHFKEIIIHNFTSYSCRESMNSFTPAQIDHLRNNLLTYEQLYEKLKLEEVNINYEELKYLDE